MKQIQFYILFSFLLFLFVQISSPIERVGVYYFFLTMGFIFLFSLPKRLLTLNIFTLLFLTLFIMNIIAYFRYGFSSEAVRIIFMLLAFLLGFISSYKLGNLTLNGIYEKILLIVIALSILRIIIYPGEFMFLIKNGGYGSVVSYPYFVVGGPNLEASTFAILAALQRKKHFFYIGLFLALSFSLLYSSRAGLIMSIIALLIFNYNYIKSIKLKNPIIIIILIIISFIVLDPKILSRLGDINTEIAFMDKGMGRFSMWQASSLLIFDDNFMGYGVGNSMDFVRQYSNEGLNNVHNIYIQTLIDGGIFSFLLYLITAIYLIKKSLTFKFSTPASRVVFIYFIIGGVQYVGYDVIAWFFVGCFFYEIKYVSYKAYNDLYNKI